MHAALLPCRAHLVTPFNEALVGLVASLTLSFSNGIVVLFDVQGKKVVGWQVLATFYAPIHVRLLVVNFVVRVARKPNHLVRWQSATDYFLLRCRLIQLREL